MGSKGGVGPPWTSMAMAAAVRTGASSCLEQTAFSPEPRGAVVWVEEEEVSGPPQVVVRLAESRAEEILQSRETESPRQRSRHPISPPAPQSSPTPTPTPTISGRPVCGEAGGGLPLLHDGRACLPGRALGGAASHPHRPRGLRSPLESRRGSLGAP